MNDSSEDSMIKSFEKKPDKNGNPINLKEHTKMI
jgi:hypothetical protein